MHRRSEGCFLGWALLHLVVGGGLSVLSLPVWPFVPEQSLAYYLSHGFYSLLQLPLLVWLMKLQQELRSG
jgi:hypothetical protein